MMFFVGNSPQRNDFTSSEWKLIEALHSPQKVQEYLYDLPYNYEENGKTIYSFREALRHHKAHCLEGALIAATILEQHGYPALLLDLESKDNIDHVLFLFKENSLYGTVGVSRDVGLHGRRPLFKTIESLVSSYYEPYISSEACITGYGVVHLQALANYDWRFSQYNLWKLERFLIDFPHHPFSVSDDRYQRRYRRYLEFKKLNPEDEPPAETYTDRHQWWRLDK